MEFREVYNRLDKCKKNTVNIVDVLCLFSDIIDSISRERSVPAAKIPLGEIEDIAGLWAKTARFLTDVYNINEKEMNKDQDEFPDLVEMQKRDRDTLLNLYQLIEDAQKAKKDHENDLNDIINEQKQLNDLKTENDNYINQIKEEKNKLESIKKVDIEASKIQLKQIQDELAELKKQNQDIENQKQKCQEEFDKQDVLSKFLQNKKTEIEQNTTRLKLENISLENEIKAAYEKKAIAANEEVQKLKVDFEICEKHYNDLESQVKDYRDHKIIIINGQIDYRQKELDKEIGRYESKVSVLNDLKEKYQKTKTNYDNCLTEIDNKEKELKDLEEEKKSLDERLEALEKQKNNLSEDKKNVVDDIDQITKQLKTVNIEELRKQLEDIKKQLSNTIEESQKINNQKVEAEKNLEKQKNYKIKLEEETKKLDEEIKPYETKISILKERKSKLEEKYREYQRILSGLEIDATYTQRIDKCQKAVAIMQDAVERLFSEISDIDFIAIGQKKKEFVDRINQIQALLEKYQEDYNLIVKAIEQGGIDCEV